MTPTAAQDALPSHAVGMLPTTGLSADVKASARSAVRGDGLKKGGGAFDKLGMELALLYYQYEEGGAAGVRALRARATEQSPTKSNTPREIQSNLLFPVSKDGQFVTIEAVASNEGTSLLPALRRLGLQRGAQVGGLVSGRFPISSLNQAAQLSTLRGMTLSYARTHVGSVESEADTSHSAYQVRSESGLDGRGQKICVLSDSYNRAASASTRASDDIQSGDLPGSGNPIGNTTPVDVLEEADSGTDEGRAMLQLIHDIAPGAELGFHTAAGGLAVFASGVRELGDPMEGDCTVVVDDIGYNFEPFYQDGPVSNAVNDVVNNDGVAYFSSAGNDGQNSYQAPFRNSGQAGVINSNSELHDFDGSSGTDTRQSITIQAGATFQIFTFQWTDPSSVVQGSDGANTDIDVALVDQNGNILVESSNDNIGTGIPVEGPLEYTNDSGAVQTLDLVIENAVGPDPDSLKYIYVGSGFQINEYDTLGPTVYGHPMAEGAMAVAAAPFFNTSAYNANVNTATLDYFSSLGGIPILYDQSGSEISPQIREKPDVTGTDYIDNTFFGTDLPTSFGNGIDSDPHPNFPGTSAAAPNIAAIAALIRQSRPSLTPTEVYTRLESTAEDVTERQNRSGDFVSVSAGVDFWSGHGFVPAPEAVPDRDVFDVQLAETSSGTGSYQLSWSERNDVTVQWYQIERQYFDEEFEEVSESVVSNGDQRSVQLGNLGLGVFQFRIKWTRSASPQDTLQRTTRPDTLGFTGVNVTSQSTDRRGRQTIALSWGVPAGTDGFSYDIERKRGADGDFQVLATTPNRSFEAERQVPGQYSYRVTARDGRGNSLTSPSREIDIEFDGAAVAIGPYPNPVQEDATVDVTIRDGQTVTIEIFNSIGERLYFEQRDLSSRTATPLRVDAERWSSGVYFLRLQGNDFSKTRKFVVVK